MGDDLCVGEVVVELLIVGYFGGEDDVDLIGDVLVVCGDGVVG